MLTDEQTRLVEPRIGLVQVITLGLITGAMVFVGLIAFMTDWSLAHQQLTMLTLIGAGSGLSMYCLAFVAPPLMATSVTSIAYDLKKSASIDEDSILKKLVESSMSSQIIFAAFIDGAIFLNTVVFLLDKSKISLAVAGLGLVILILSFPLKSRWLMRLSERTRDVKSEMDLIG